MKRIALVFALVALAFIAGRSSVPSVKSLQILGIDDESGIVTVGYAGNAYEFEFETK